MNNKGMSSNTLPRGSDLLKGLYLVNNYLLKANEKLNKYWNLESQYRNEGIPSLSRLVNTNTVTQKLLYGLFIIGIAYTLIGIFNVIFGVNKSEVISSLIVVGIFAYGKAKQKKIFLIIGTLCLITTLLVWLDQLNKLFLMIRLDPSGALLHLAINIIAFVVAGSIAWILHKKGTQKYEKEKADVEAHNKIIAQQCKELANEIQSILKEMQAKTDYWFPPDYYVIECVSKFIDYVKNHEADTVKEMLEVYKQEKHRNHITTHFSSLINNQKKMIHQQRFANFIQLGNFITNLSNNQALKRNADATEKIADTVDGYNRY